MALHSAHTARIRANGLLFGSVILSNSIRQVCPLSFYLYILAMEHLAVSLQSNASIQGVQVGDTPQKCCLFADDLLMQYPSFACVPSAPILYHGLGEKMWLFAFFR